LKTILIKLILQFRRGAISD